MIFWGIFTGIVVIALTLMGAYERKRRRLASGDDGFTTHGRDARWGDAREGTGYYFTGSPGSITDPNN